MSYRGTEKVFELKFTPINYQYMYFTVSLSLSCLINTIDILIKFRTWYSINSESEMGVAKRRVGCGGRGLETKISDIPFHRLHLSSNTPGAKNESTIVQNRFLRSLYKPRCLLII